MSLDFTKLKKVAACSEDVIPAIAQCADTGDVLIVGYVNKLALETAVKSTTSLMEHGSTTYLEILTAQTSLLNAQITVIANKLDEINGVISLYQALGGGKE